MAVKFESNKKPFHSDNQRVTTIKNIAMGWKGDYLHLTFHKDLLIWQIILSYTKVGL